MKYQLSKLKYSNNALEPYIDEQTVVFHHDKHQQAYVDKLNIALESEVTSNCDCSVGELISDLSKVPESIRTDVKNNGGGVYNHEFLESILNIIDWNEVYNRYIKLRKCNI